MVLVCASMACGRFILANFLSRTVRAFLGLFKTFSHDVSMNGASAFMEEHGTIVIFPYLFIPLSNHGSIFERRMKDFSCARGALACT